MSVGTFPAPFPVEDPEGLAAQEEAYGDLAASIRPLVDACVRTRVDVDEARAVAAQVRELTDRLLTVAQDEPLGFEACSDGRMRGHANIALGMRNPIAPPMRITSPEEGRSASAFHLGVAYEGPPGHVHGGWVATILDQVLGVVPAMIGRPGLTAYLNVTYRRPTPLGDLSAAAWVAERGEWKTLVKGEVYDAEGQVTAEAEGLFVVPRWARERLGTPTGDAGEFDRPAGGHPLSREG